MKKSLALLLIACLPVLGFDVAEVFESNVQVFRESNNPVNAIHGFETIVNAYDLGEIEGPEAFDYYLKSLEYLCVLYYNQGELQTAQTLFEKIVRAAPAHALNRPFISPRIIKEFNDFREGIVGFIRVRSNVNEPELTTGTLTLMPDNSGSYPVPSGERTVRIGKVNYAPVQESVVLQPGETIDIQVELERTHAAIELVTEPTEVDVYLDGIQVGTTSGSASAAYIHDAGQTIAELGLTPSLLSNVLRVNGVNAGSHLLELRKPCYRPLKLDLVELELRDYAYKAMRLQRSVGFLVVEPGAPDETGDLFVDGRRVGTLPIKDLEVCAGRHQLKVSFEKGTFIKTVTVEEGERRVVRAVPKPTLLYAGIQAIDSNTAIVEDVQRRLLEAFRTIPFYNVEHAASYTNAIDRMRGGDTTVMETIREEYGQSLVIFGVEKRIKLKRYVDIFLLNTELFHLEEFPIDPVDAASMEKLVSAVKNMPELMEPFSGVNVVTDPDLGRPVVIASTASGISDGDVILKVNGVDVNNAREYHKSLQPGEAVLSVLREGTAMDVTLVVENAPIVMRQNLNSISYNAAYLYYRSRAAFARSQVEKASAQLNLAMCLLRFRDVERAFDTLTLVTLPDTPGIGAGTVHYLRGVCYQEIESWMNLQTLFKNYTFSDQATVIDSRGMRVKDLIDFTFEYLRKQ